MAEIIKKRDKISKEAGKTFNVIITGTGGQGLITLLDIITEAAVSQGLDVKTSELHGLSQRGGSINTHIRIGEKVHSPLVALGSADLVLSLEILESLRVINYANSETISLINRYSVPFIGTIPEKETEDKINKLVKGKKYVIPAAEICQKELGKDVVAGIYLLSYASFKKMLPLKPESILKAIFNRIPQKYLDLNVKAFKLAEKYANK